MDDLKPYPACQETAIPWLGQVPAHWELRRLKTLLRQRSEKGYPDEPMLAATQTKGVVRKENYENRTVLALKDLHLLKLVRSGDFVISLRSFQGGIEYAREQGIISPAYTILYPVDTKNHGYLAKLFKSKPFIENLNLYVTGIRQGQNIDYEKLSRSDIALPPSEEQTAIARYLDWADGRIRRLIRARQKQIKLLEEHKQAVIQQAVTGQIDVKTGEPYPVYKDSGIEWLGQVPEHWEVSALRHKYRSELGKMLDTKRITGKYLVSYLRNTDVQWDYINTNDLPKMDISSSEYERYTLKKGDLLVCEGGEVGRSAIWQGELELCGFQKALHRVQSLDSQKDNPRFLYYVMFSTAKKGIFLSDGSENTIPHLTGVKLRRHRFAFPPKIEQDAIVTYLNDFLGKISQEISLLKENIKLLNEYRTRLIADVVTGKVDVRQVAASLPEIETEAEPSEAWEEETELDEDEELLEEGEDAE